MKVYLDLFLTCIHLLCNIISFLPYNFLLLFSIQQFHVLNWHVRNATLKEKKSTSDLEDFFILKVPTERN